MNSRRFRLIFSQRRRMLVPVAELCAAGRSLQKGTTARGERAQADRPSPLVWCCRLLPLVLAVALALPARANPLGAVVEHGAASFDQQGATLTVTNSPGAIIRWQEFSIDAHETTRFIQQNAASAVLNRIAGDSPSVILGQLQSNGQVWLINPNGVMFGAGAQVDVGGLVASSLDLRNEDFLAGSGRFEGSEHAGAVRNDGLIRTEAGGAVMLIAPQVENHGVIVSPQGDIVLAAGHTVELAELSNPALRVEITAGGEAVNVGQLLAESGAVGMHAGLVRQAGEVSAAGAVVEGGRVFLRSSGTTRLGQGSLTTADGAVGGEIRVLGEQVEVQAGARVSAVGEGDGGTILVGGDYLGGNPDIQNAQRTWIGPDSSLSANAGRHGDGGKVIVWADDKTISHGDVSARGGLWAAMAASSRLPERTHWS